MEYLITARNDKFHRQITVSLSAEELSNTSARIDRAYTSAAIKGRKDLGIEGSVKGRASGDYGQDGTFRAYSPEHGEYLIGVASLE